MDWRVATVNTLLTTSFGGAHFQTILKDAKYLLGRGIVHPIREPKLSPTGAMVSAVEFAFLELAKTLCCVVRAKMVPSSSAMVAAPKSAALIMDSASDMGIFRGDIHVVLLCAQRLHERADNGQTASSQSFNYSKGIV
eukprot:scaffold2744_cov136-Cylindrotheca_fusiformis.AAC.9